MKIKLLVEKYLNEMAYRPKGKADRIVDKIVYDWPDWYYHDVKRKELATDLKKDFKIDDKKANFILDIWGDFKSNRINLGEFQEFVHGVLQGEKYYGP